MNYRCELCNEVENCQEWEIIQIDMYGDVIKICLDCYEGICFWWDAFFEDYPEELEKEIMFGFDE